MTPENQASAPQQEVDVQEHIGAPGELSPQANRVQPPLTDTQIAEINKSRYPGSLSQDEIKRINDARAGGIHHGV